LEFGLASLEDQFGGSAADGQSESVCFLVVDSMSDTKKVQESSFMVEHFLANSAVPPGHFHLAAVRRMKMHLRWKI